MITLRFAKKKLEAAFKQRHEAIKLWGDAGLANTYIARVNALQAVNHVSEFGKAFPHYHDHGLKGKKAGRRAFILKGRWRLEYTPDEDGKGVTIEEVSNHYGD